MSYLVVRLSAVDQQFTLHQSTAYLVVGLVTVDHQRTVLTRL